MRFPDPSGVRTHARRRGTGLLLACWFGMAASLLSACTSSHIRNNENDTGAIAAAPLAVVKPVIDCAALASVDLRDIGGAGSRITSASVTTTVVNGASVSLCAVKGVLAPSNSFAVALPVDTWTQRFAALGCGGLCGNVADPGKLDEISFSYRCPLVQEGGFVTAATDMGHAGRDATWTTNPQQQADFAYRGQHITTLAAKKLIAAYYGQPQKYAYFVGCSDGGREALMAAQRFPNDYNGIVAGAPAAHFQIQNSVYHGWNVLANSTTGTSAGNAILYGDKVAVLHKTVLAACADTPDGLISDPRACGFDPASIQCAAGAGDVSQCLTAAEVGAARKIYDGPLDARTRAPLQAGRPPLGSEGNWPGVEVPRSATSTGTPVPVSGGLFSYNIVSGAYKLIFDGTPAVPNLDTFAYADAGYYRSHLAANHPLYDATNPDLSAFRRAGGKLILWHGWADQHISPRYTIAYYEAMQDTMGRALVDGFVRMYLVPGVGHCGGGEGLANIDLVSQISGWVEQQRAPAGVTTRRTDAAGAVTASRPVYPYPALARYKGSGDWRDAANYASAAPIYTMRTPAWAGAMFHTPYAPKQQGVALPR